MTNQGATDQTSGRVRTLPPPESWAGKPAYIVGGGPSLKTFDWNTLKDRPHVCVLNMAYVEVPTAELWFTEDLRGIERIYAVPELKEQWERFQGLKVFHSLSPRFGEIAKELDPSITLVHRRRDDKFWSKDWDKDGLALSSNSMVGLLNIVDILGAEPIYILGLDCNPTGGKLRHYHEGRYPDVRDWVTGDQQYVSFKSDFEHWVAPHLRHREIINLNPTSAVDCWPKKDWREVLK